MKIVIVGGGFGGVRAALKLANNPKFSVRLISKQNYFEYHAALYRSATGRSPLEVTIPLVDFFESAKNIEVIEDTIVSINSDSKTLTGKSSTTYHFDAVIFAIGGTTQYYGIEGLAKYSYGIKSIREALELKRHLHQDLLSNSGPEHNYVVVGAGASGVELAAELKYYLKKIRRKHHIRRRIFNVDLVEGGSHVLPSLPEKFTKIIHRRLRKLGIKIYLNTSVKGETVDAIQLPRGSIKSHIVIWTAGVANNPFFSQFPEIFKLSKNGRVGVNQFLEAAPNIYIIGDSADTHYSGMAQTALHDANFVVKDIVKKSQDKPRVPYEPKKPVYAIPVGSHWSAVLLGDTIISGRLGWLVRRLADLKLYLTFLPLGKALSTWRYGMTVDETCKHCK
jgi:NADH:ubiquinone reductase (H+-translocating)